MGGTERRAAAIAALDSSGIVKAGAHSASPARHTRVDPGILPLDSLRRSSSVSTERSTPWSSVKRHSAPLKPTSPGSRLPKEAEQCARTDCTQELRGGRSPRGIVENSGQPATGAVGRRHLWVSKPASVRVLLCTALGTLVSVLFELLRDLLAPRECPGCGGVVERSAVFCAACAATVEPAPNPDGSSCLAAHLFGGAVRDAIHRLKYGKRSDLARPLGHLLRACLARSPSPPRVDFVLPVPLHLARLVDRGFNQSGLLARSVAQHVRVPLRTGVLRRTAAGPAQAGLDRAARLTNVASAFSVTRASAVRGKHVLVVDDVVTTGATLDACRKALLAAGAASVTCVALARAGVERDAPPDQKKPD